MNIKNELTSKEKTILARNSLLLEKTNENTITNISSYLSDNFNKIDGFQYKWNSLITSNPLLFEDIDYMRCKQYVNNIVTDEEIQAYKNGELRELYATFENMLICNLQYYDRIMSYCTMIFLHYHRLNEDEITSKYMDEVPYIFDMTPTQIWCAALTNKSSTKWELNYAWSINNNKVAINEPVGDESMLQANWNNISLNKTFNRFIEYCALRVNRNGFREVLLYDKTPNKKLAQVCSKFTSTSTAISEDQLSTIFDYIQERETVNKKLYSALFNALLKMFNNDETQFGIYVYSDEFYIYSTKFSIQVNNQDGKLNKVYLANAYECFIAEEGLINTIKEQINWVKHEMPIHYDYDKQILISLLNQMLKESYRDIMCIKRMNEYGIVSKITFSGIFNHVTIIEKSMLHNNCIKETRVTRSKLNAAKYIIERGYYIFGLQEDIFKFSLENSKINRQSINKHYFNYCVPVLQHLESVIELHKESKNEIIDVLCSGILNPDKLNNNNIKYTNIKSVVNPRTLMNNISNKQKQFQIKNKKSYWKVIQDD